MYNLFIVTTNAAQIPVQFACTLLKEQTLALASIWYFASNHSQIREDKYVSNDGVRCSLLVVCDDQILVVTGEGGAPEY
jgi:hypothetical protein